MIYEYALDPRLVATWFNRRDCRYFINAFGLGSPRIVSRYTKKWKRLVWQEFAGSGDLDKKRMEELIARLSEKMIVRSNAGFKEELSWLENAENEDATVPFRLIMSTQNPRFNNNVLAACELHGDEDKWVCPTSLPIPRAPEQMAEVAKGLLVNAKHIVLIDPHFGPENRRHRRPFEAFMAAIAINRAIEPPESIQVLTGTKTDEAFFHRECQEKLSGLIPLDLKVTLQRIASREGGEQLHNRYILSDIGGITFGTGLDEDESDGTSSDDVYLLSKSLHEFRSQQYLGHKTVFEALGKPVVVMGKKRI